MLIDSYSESNYSYDFAQLDDADNVYAAQSFTGDGTKVSSAKFYLKKVGSPTGNITAFLYDHSGTFGTSSIPTGSALSTSSSIDSTTLTTSMALYEFTFPSQYTTVNGTKYCIVVYRIGGDSGNTVVVGGDNTSPSHAGNASKYVSSWTAYSGTDLCFYVYNSNVLTLSTQYPTSIGLTTATLNGTIEDIAGETCDYRGFVYGTSPVDNPGNVAPGSSGYDSYAQDSGSYSTGSYSNNITSLNQSTGYYVRSFAHNASGYSYGNELKFYTGTTLGWLTA